MILLKLLLKIHIHKMYHHIATPNYSSGGGSLGTYVYFLRRNNQNLLLNLRLHSKERASGGGDGGKTGTTALGGWDFELR